MYFIFLEYCTLLMSALSTDIDHAWEYSKQIHKVPKFSSASIVTTWQAYLIPGTCVVSAVVEV